MVDKETFLCQICRELKKQNEIVPALSVPEPIAELIRKEYPPWSSGGNICRADLDRFRAIYVGEVLGREKNELAVLEEAVRQSMIDHAFSLKISISNLTGSWGAVFRSYRRLCGELDIHHHFYRSDGSVDRD